MNELKLFDNPVFGTIRTTQENGKVLFCGTDVAKTLGYADPYDAIRRHTKGSVKRPVLTPGGEQQVNFIPIGDVHRLIAHSHLPEAEKYESWVFDEVLPDIQQHGMYATPDTVDKLLSDPETAITILTRYKDERDKRMALEAQAVKDAPKVLFADSVAESEQTILIGELAKLMKQNGFDIGQNRLFERLRKDGYLCSVGERRNLPTQKAMEMKLFEIKERTINNPDGSVRLTMTVKVTGKGQIYFINRYRVPTLMAQ